MSCQLRNGHLAGLEMTANLSRSRLMHAHEPFDAVHLRLVDQTGGSERGTSCAAKSTPTERTGTPPTSASQELMLRADQTLSIDFNIPKSIKFGLHL
eukprot:4745368-Amphidinium_carterae.1